MESNDSLTSYVAAFVDELGREGVKDVVISPGSRSTPMAILMAEHPDINIFVNIDERSAAFFALGIAKAKKKTVALLCTSGTAAANYYPAIVEAHYSRVPLLVLTADRPHELRDVGAPQAINQNQLYGHHVKWFVEMALPEQSTQMLNYVRTMAGRAAGKALATPAGPVHLNFPFREPLIPNLQQDHLFENQRKINPANVKVLVGKPTLDSGEFNKIHQVLNSSTRGMIVCGQHDDEEFLMSVTELAHRLQFPILADPLSQLRSGQHDKTYVIDNYDTFLRNEDFIAEMKPDLILRFGAMPVSKSLLQYIQKHPDAIQLVVDGDGGWREPTLSASEMIYSEESIFCKELINRQTAKEKTDWVDQWLKINTLSKLNIQDIKEDTLFEGKVITELQEILPNQATLFVGNSMPIRDLDTFFEKDSKSIKTMANRGANGIDGIVSTALGVSVHNKHTVLVIGDLSFYHDLNGLLAAKLHHLDLTIVLINNDGGGIFSFLPQSKEETHFESLFGTPIGLEYEHVVKMYNGVYNRVQSWEDFRLAVNNSMAHHGLSVIELQTDRAENVAIHRKLWNRVSQEIRHSLKGL